MMKALKLIITMLALFTVHCHAQLYNGFEIATWKLMQLSGGIGIQGTYGTNTIENDFGLLNKTERSAFSGFINFDSKSYFWHPDLVVLDVGVSYNPSVYKFTQIVSPDFAMALDKKSMDVSAQFLRQKRLTLSTRASYSETYVNSENITNSKNTNKSFGGSLKYKNNFANLNFAYDVRDSKSKYENTDRVLSRSGTSFRFYTMKAMKWYFRTHLEASHRTDKNSFLLNRTSIIETDRILMNSNVNFTRNQNYTLNSKIEYFNQKLSSNYERLRFFERLNFRFSERLTWATTSSYMINGFGTGNTNQFFVNNNMSYQLYNSLFSSAFGSYSNVKSNFVKQNAYNYGFATQYIKKIPLDGKLRLNYTYSKQINETKGLSNIIQVINEEHTLSDNEVVLLKNPNIFKNTIVVKDDTGTLIYDENLDYILYETGNFIEIQRLPGGLISDNSKVLISYSSDQNGDFTTNSKNNSFSAGIFLFKDVINFNYNYSTQNFDDASDINYESENYFKRTGYNGSINYKFFQGGVEQERFNSELVPYKRFSYYFNVHGNFKQHVLYSLNYRVNEFSMMQEQGREEKRAYLTAMVAYSINRNNKLNLMLGYNKRTVNDFEVNWLSARLSYIKYIGKINLAANINFFDSNSLYFTSNYFGGNLSIVRTF